MRVEPFSRPAGARVGIAWRAERSRRDRGVPHPNRGARDRERGSGGTGMEDPGPQDVRGLARSWPARTPGADHGNLSRRRSRDAAAIRVRGRTASRDGGRPQSVAAASSCRGRHGRIAPTRRLSRRRRPGGLPAPIPRVEGNLVRGVGGYDPTARQGAHLMIAPADRFNSLDIERQAAGSTRPCRDAHRPAGRPAGQAVVIRTRPVARVLIAGVRAYQVFRGQRLSPCRYWPTCSAYAIEAMARHGAARGSWLAVRRLARCHPWGPYGGDPVPE